MLGVEWTPFMWRQENRKSKDERTLADKRKRATRSRKPESGKTVKIPARSKPVLGIKNQAWPSAAGAAPPTAKQKAKIPARAKPIANQARTQCSEKNQELLDAMKASKALNAKEQREYAKAHLDPKRVEWLAAAKEKQRAEQKRIRDELAVKKKEAAKILKAQERKVK
jgi:hypothetical protein